MAKRRKTRKCHICKKRPVWRGGDVKNPGPFCKKCYHKKVWIHRPGVGNEQSVAEDYVDYLSGIESEPPVYYYERLSEPPPLVYMPLPEPPLLSVSGRRRMGMDLPHVPGRIWKRTQTVFSLVSGRRRLGVDLP